MTSEERARMEELCRQIAVEKNPNVFDRLVQELEDLIEVKQQRIRATNNPELQALQDRAEELKVLSDHLVEEARRLREESVRLIDKSKELTAATEIKSKQ